ncbi:hatching enzyme 1.2-like [Panulirus ornatus]|uniref:hatching enzyme 1.2-like n=1 Tax=Panulirus ornatus TaxID=150431 RepID=UPI003A8715F4
MLVWACVGVVMIMKLWVVVGAAVHVRSSDPVLEAQVSQPHLDTSNFLVPLGNPDIMETDIPGAPLTPDDFLEGNVMEHKDWDPDTKADPIELAKLFQGDISLMTLDEYYELVQPSETARFRNAMMNLDERWVNGVIPYVISGTYEKKERAIIAAAMRNYHDQTCIRFVPRTGERDYIHIIKANGCSSSVGRRGGAQAVSLGLGCIYVGIVMHEFMHAAGFWHEQSREDRDDYITINDYNIQTGMEYNFQKYRWGRIQDLGVNYDLGSIMHYGAYAFAKDRTKPTIIPRELGAEIGQRRALSKLLLPTAANMDQCLDEHEHCQHWASINECRVNPQYMLSMCRKACGMC